MKATLVELEDGLGLIDTGFTSEDADLIVHEIEQLKVEEKTLRFCLLTHSHPDHVGGLKKLASGMHFEVLAHSLEAPEIVRSTGVQVTRTVEDGEVLDLGRRVEVIHTPGHTAGSISLYIPDAETLATGDAVFSAGQWLLEPPAYLTVDPQQAKKSIQKLIGLGRKTEQIIVGHGEDLREKGTERLKLLQATSRVF